MSDLVVATIVGKNYLAQARVLSRSLRTHNPDAKMVVLLIDEVDGYIDPRKEPFELVKIDELSITDRPALCFKYSVLELATAVKPFLLEHIFHRFAAKKVIYLDPDIEVFNTLSPLEELLDRHSILLTPHTTAPLEEDDCTPTEVTFLQSGAYNLGFIGLADTMTTRRMLSWWQARCEKYCVSQPREGLFVDQKWVDLVPGLFGDVNIVRDPGYNVAYWNLHERQIALGSEPKVNGQPLRFFHFSGYDPDKPDVVSKHQTRFEMKNIGEARTLFSLYGERLLAEGYREVKHFPYSHGQFHGGVSISPLIRRVFYELGADSQRFGNPFKTHEGSFFEWLNAPATRERDHNPYLSNLISQIPRYREDIRTAFPDYWNTDRQAFFQWLARSRDRDLALDPVFLEPIASVKNSVGPGRIGPVGKAPGRIRLRALWHVLRAFPDGSCRVCAALPLIDRWGYRESLRGAVVKRLRTSARRMVSDPPSYPSMTTADAGPIHRDALRRLVKAVLRPCSAHLNLTKVVGTSTTAPRLGSRAVGPPQSIKVMPGLNIAGYFTTESGVGEAARLIAQAVQAVELPHVLLNFGESYNLRREDDTFANFASNNPHEINLIHVNADQVHVFAQTYGERFFEDRYNIGFWMWELPDFPPEWCGSFRYFDEIWAASTFATEALAKASPIPTIKMPLPVRPYAGPVLGRAHFGLRPDDYIFLFIFDFMSVFQRKNPLAVLEAFKRAFPANDDKVQLVVKYSNADTDPTNAARLREAATASQTKLIEGYLSRQEIASLIQNCDAYVSLHRSEGFGLTMAEAMSVGKPVIATGYSANMDFMNVGNSFPVRYRIVELAKDEGPYQQGSSWADPDVEHAAEQMRWVFDRSEAAAAIAAQAKADIATYYSLDAVGRRIATRLQQIAGVGRERSPIDVSRMRKSE